MAANSGQAVPLGQRLRVGGANTRWSTIVGIVENVRQMGLDVAGRAAMYFPCTQPAASYGYYAPRDLAVRVAGEPLRYRGCTRSCLVHRPGPARIECDGDAAAMVALRYE
jgi:hypothetical protein